jgi:putative flippase GtrA
VFLDGRDKPGHDESVGGELASVGRRQLNPTARRFIRMRSGLDTGTPRAQPSRLFAMWAAAPRFLRNAAISGPMFGLDLALLALLVRRAHVDYLAATIAAFLVANGLSYFLARWLVFAGTTRGVRSGFVWFLSIAALAALAVTALMWLFVGVLHIDVIVSRIAAAVVTGVGGYLMNLMLNFRVAHRTDPGSVPPR